MSRTEIKTIAKARFKDHWGDLLLVLALQCTAICLAIVLGFGVGELIVLGPLCVGVYYVYTRTIYNEGTDWKDMFFGFRKMFGNSFTVGAMICAIAIIAASIIGTAMGIINFIITAIQTSVSSTGYFSIGIYFVTLFITICAVIIVLILTHLFYAEAPLLLLKEPGIKPADAMRKSRLMMNGNKGRLFILSLSFIGWGILCVLTLGALLVYVAPYYMYARVMLLNQIYEERHGVSMTDDADMQRLNAMRENAMSRKEAVADRIREKTVEDRSTEPSAAPAGVNVCKYCGTRLPEGASFCAKCGKRQ